MQIRRPAVVFVAAMVVTAASPGIGSASPAQRVRVIVVLEEELRDPEAAARDLTRRHGGTFDLVYRHALKGFAAEVPEQAVAGIARDRRVAFVERDGLARALGQTIPTGIDRIDGDLNLTAAVDVVDADIAILDTGIELNHNDLYVYRNTNCTKETGGPWWMSTVYCEDGSGNDGHGHGTHVAGVAGAKDNDYGVVGVAPGARLWAVKVLSDNGSGKWSWVLAGIDYVAANAGAIDVANMSLGGQGYSQALRDALRGAVAKGVTFTVAAGNDGEDVYGNDGTLGTGDDHVPAAYPEVAAISAMADSDGAPGGLGPSTSYGPDDSFASFSNRSASVVAGNPVVSPGKAIDLLAPGVGILSTYKNGNYARMSGTSMASPHAVGLAARHVAAKGRNLDGDAGPDADDVALIRQAFIDAGKDQASGLRLAYPSTEPDPYPEKLGWASASAPAPGNTIPVASPDTAGTSEDTPVTINVLANDSDADGDPLTVASVTQSANGSATVNADSTVTYAPKANFNGTDSFSYTASDGKGGTASATVTVTVAAVNDAPVAADDSYTTPVGTTLSVAAPGVLANDSDVDGDALSAVLASGPAAGALTLGANGSLSYAPNTGFAGTDSFTYRASDGFLMSNLATVTITVANTTSTHIADLDGVAIDLRESYWKARVTIAVHDNTHAATGGATVSFSWSDGSTGQCTTDATGQCTVESAAHKKGDMKALTLTVTGVAKGTLSYDSAANHDADGDTNGTNITVNKIN